MLGLSSQHRLLREFKELHSNPLSNILACPFSAKNLSHWNARLKGPPNTPYQGGTFYLTIKFPSNYPIAPPYIQFNTKIYHCNINSKGRVCTDLLENWRSETSVSQLLLEVYFVLIECNPHSPLVQEFSDLYLQDKKAYQSNAKDWTITFAGDYSEK